MRKNQPRTAGARVVILVPAKEGMVGRSDPTFGSFDDFDRVMAVWVRCGSHIAISKYAPLIKALNEVRLNSTSDGDLYITFPLGKETEADMESLASKTEHHLRKVGFSNIRRIDVMPGELAEIVFLSTYFEIPGRKTRQYIERFL